MRLPPTRQYLRDIWRPFLCYFAFSAMNEFSSDSDAPSPRRLVEWFISPEIRSDPDRYRRARIFIITTLVLAPLSSLMGTVFALVGGLPPFGATGFAIAALIALSKPFLLCRLPHWQRKLSHLLLAEILIVFAFQASIDAGIRDPSILIILVVPWLAALLLGQMGGIYWSGAVSALLLGFYVLHQYGLAHPDPSPEEAHWWFQLIAGTLATTLVGGMGYAYERRRAQMTKALCLQREQAQRHAEGLTQERDALIAERGQAFDQAARQARENEQRLARMSRDIRRQVMHLAGVHAALAPAQTSGDGLPPDSADPPCQNVVEKTAGDILRVLDSAEELNRLSSDAPETKRQPVDLHDLLEGVLEDVLQDHSAEESAPSFFYEAPAFKPLVHCDPHHLRRALSLLATRALRLYPEGEVTVSIERHPGGRESGEGLEAKKERLEAKMVFRRPSPGAQEASAVGGTKERFLMSALSEQDFPDRDFDLQLATRLTQLAGGALRISRSADHETFALSSPRCDP